MLTMGDRGAIHFRQNERDEDRLSTDYLPALGEVAIDAICAGDVFLAGMALCDVSGIDLNLGLYFSSCLSALKIGRIGNRPSSTTDLQSFLLTRPELQESR